MRLRRSTCVLAVVTLLPIAAVVAAHPAAASANPTIVVTTTADVVDGSDGELSLREAVALANATAGDDTILLASGATYSLTLCAGVSDPDNSVGDLDGTGTDGLTIEGSPAPAVSPTISQTCEQPVIFQGFGTLTLKDLAITGGNGTSFGAVSSLGALRLDHVDQSLATAAGGSDAAAIRSFHDVVVTDSSIHDNMIMGINAFSNLTLTRSSVTTNHTATGIAGGFMVSHTATLDDSDLSGNAGKEVGGGDMANAVITGSTVNNNTGRAGGLLGTFSLTDSQLDNNYGTELSGGGIGQFTILRSSVNDNQGHVIAGGLTGVGTVTDSTMTGNYSLEGIGGAILAQTPTTPWPVTSVTIENSTITHNYGYISGGVVVADNWAQRLQPTDPTVPIDIEIDRSTVEGNLVTAGTTSAPLDFSAPASDLAFTRWAGEPTDHGVGSLTVGSSVLGPGWGGGVDVCSLGAASDVDSTGYTFSSDSSCVGEGPGDVAAGGDPGLGALANNGGETQSMVPQPGSPLIDRVPASLASCAGSSDQRDVPRPIGAGCDMGSVEAPGQLFRGVDPVRLIDSRPIPQRVGPFAAWGAGVTHDVSVVGGATGVPPTATAVVLNVTATGGSRDGNYLSLWPAGKAQPTVSSVNVNAGATVSNQVTVQVGTGANAGNVSVFNAGGTQQVIIDIDGYYSPQAMDEGYHGLAPGRIIDSRPPPQRVGPAGSWTAGETRLVTVGDLAGVPPEADAVVLNVTATNGTANGDYLSVWPAGTPQPTVSNVNVDAHRTVASAVTVRLGIGTDRAQIAVYNAGGTQDVLIDVVGYFDTGSGQAFFPLTPGRLIDSRPVPQRVGPLGPWGPDAAQAVDVTAGPPGVPAGATGLVANVTVTGGTVDHDYLTVWGDFLHPMPNASMLNFDAGQTVANAVTTSVDRVVDVDHFLIYNAAGTTNVIVDVSGYYA